MKQLAILGGGPAGLTASIYASRYNIDHVLIAPEIGGYLNEIHEIQNYPGFLSIPGYELTQKMKRHAENFEVKIINKKADSIEKIEKGFGIKTSDGEVFEAENIIFAAGTVFRRMNIPGEQEFSGKGVSYCATCDGPFFKDKKVVVVGGGNSAAVAALILSEYSKEVAIVYRGESLACAPAFTNQINNTNNIKVIQKANITSIEGDEKVEKVTLDREVEGKNEIEADGVFVEIGSDPNINLVEPIGLELDKNNYIQTQPDQSTGVLGFFAAGDVTTNSNKFRQIITACSEGAIAAHSVYRKLKSEKQ